MWLHMATNRSKNLQAAQHTRIAWTLFVPDLQLAANLHFHLHRPASFEGGSAPDNESEIVRSQLRVAVGGIGICVFGTGENRRALDAGPKSLLSQCQTLQLFEPVAFGRAIDQSILQKDLFSERTVDG